MMSKEMGKEKKPAQKPMRFRKSMARRKINCVTP
jgi:hypothetical protein